MSFVANTNSSSQNYVGDKYYFRLNIVFTTSPENINVRKIYTKRFFYSSLTHLVEKPLAFIGHPVFSTKNSIFLLIFY